MPCQKPRQLGFVVHVTTPGRQSVACWQLIRVANYPGDLVPAAYQFVQNSRSDVAARANECDFHDLSSAAWSVRLAASSPHGPVIAVEYSHLLLSDGCLRIHRQPAGNSRAPHPVGG